ncbi:hypothetical protein K501DRAFT_333610 [Backusella circina FSU 941]|nr:hypothetical protein K501DRAFT_333610 [Backusella circina FSU 941]
MAPLEVIGAGIGRSGTDSLRTALDILGYNTMHFKNFFYDLRLDPDLFINAHYNRQETDWDKVYENYTAAVDIPTWIWYKDLMKKYPDAKVVLTMRDPDSWYKSVKRIHSRSDIMKENVVPKEPLKKRFELADVIINKSELLNPETFVDEEYTKALYRKHYEEVIATVPEEKLFIMELGEGWDRLCAFLGKEVPDVPYPRVNTGDDFEMFMQDVAKNPYFVEKQISV